MIPFNKPFIAGKELYYIAQAVAKGNLGGDGEFTLRCAQILESQFGIGKVLMTPSCTASLEMAAQLCSLEPGDEVIVPSFTFVSTAAAFVRLGAKPVFVDIREDTLNLDESLIEDAITSRTKAICVVHYAGVAAEMDAIMSVARKHGLLVVEDAAQGVNSWYKGRALGSIGDLSTYSFHETKTSFVAKGVRCVSTTPTSSSRQRSFGTKARTGSDSFAARSISTHGLKSDLPTFPANSAARSFVRNWRRWMRLQRRDAGSTSLT